MARRGRAGRVSGGTSGGATGRVSGGATGRERGQERSAARRATQYHRLRHPFAPQVVFSDDEIWAIHTTALRILQELGIKVLLPEARQIFAKAGARVQDGEMVFIDGDMVDAALASIPREIRLRAANPMREQTYAPGSLIFTPGSGCPNVSDMTGGRRPGNLRDFESAVKLCQSFDAIHKFGPCTEPQDVAAHLRHYDMTRAQIEFGDKPMFLYARGRAQVQQGFEMVQTALDLSADDFTDGVWTSTVINSNSPRLLDNPMAQGIIDFARAEQLAVITPFCLAGAMAPITPAGALALQHAEALFCMTLSQLVRPGAPVSYGGFSSNVDMKSGAPAFGTPEHMKMQIGGGQLARLFNLPWRSAVGAAANMPDMQASLENNMSLWGALMANATMVVHSAGWLEGGLTFGFEKLINDIEALQTIAEMCVKPTADPAEIGFDAIAEVAPGGHFFATQHTMARYRGAFYDPLVADLSNFGSWSEAGSKSATQRACGIWQQTLAAFSPPPTSGAAMDRLRPYIEKARQAGGAPVMD